ncbi:hypothetical protein C8Z91_02835 [Paenibacillus elgii]|uniref:Baseplate protein J-like domain-containing protein n=1 Tax=Paenibacillus elgii TaxID=189691 RepID=A0A2T6G9H5_9BACL|nr:baseplate J/gp47 family protein [Paenibacillus elgii]PUA40781.1 hypothetical protein C8Z91_02835 [Paenibacillus elgii]
MTVLPDYLKDQTEEAIMQRMLDALPSDLDKAEGSYIWDSLAPAAIQLAQGAIWAREVLRRGFVGSTFGEYLDLRCAEHGITRKAAVKARGEIQFKGATGAEIAAGTIVATLADSAIGEPSIEFKTLSKVVLDPSGAGTVNIEAIAGGKSGNVSARAIQLLVSPLSGISSVTNLKETSGGLNMEDDAALQLRYLQRVRSTSAGGNKADYMNWVTEVSGVGGAAIMPVDEGPGTVGIYVVDTSMKPASLAIAEAVQHYIAPPYTLVEEDSVLVQGGKGVSTDTSQQDARNKSSLQFAYSSDGIGTAKRTELDAALPKQAGIWRVRPHFKVSSTAGTTNLVEFGIWNHSRNGWAKTGPSSTVDAVQVKPAKDLLSFFKYSGSVDPIVASRDWPVWADFYWNGEDHLELRITRLQSDTTTTLWLDNVVYTSAFSKNTGEGKAPIGVRVSVRPAIQIPIDIKVTLNVLPGSNVTAIQNEIKQKFDKYLTSLSFKENNDVLYTRLGQIILDTQGVVDYDQTSFFINNSQKNIIVSANEVAVLGDVTFR